MRNLDNMTSPMVLNADKIANMQDIIDVLSMMKIVVDGADQNFYKVAHLFRYGIPDGKGNVS
jgi:hypothetical protein